MRSSGGVSREPSGVYRFGRISRPRGRPSLPAGLLAAAIVVGVLLTVNGRNVRETDLLGEADTSVELLDLEPDEDLLRELATPEPPLPTDDPDVIVVSPVGAAVVNPFGNFIDYYTDGSMRLPRRGGGGRE